jgi:hypothetical protein
LYFGIFRSLGSGFRGGLGSGDVVEVLAHFFRDRHFNRTRMGLFFRDA